MKTIFLIYSENPKYKSLLEYLAKQTESSSYVLKVLSFPDHIKDVLKEKDQKILIFLDRNFLLKEENLKLQDDFSLSLRNLKSTPAESSILMIGILPRSSFCYDIQCPTDISLPELSLIMSKFKIFQKPQNELGPMSRVLSLKLDLKNIREQFIESKKIIEDLIPEKIEAFFNEYCSKECESKKKQSGQHLFCEKASTNNCQLRKFQNYLLALDLIKIKADMKDKRDYEESLLALDSFLEKLWKTKEDFCTKECSLVKKGIDFKKGDILISDSKSLFQGQCFYCQHHNCPVNTFFFYFNLIL